MMVSEKQWLHMCIMYVIVVDVVLPVIFAQKNGRRAVYE